MRQGAGSGASDAAETALEVEVARVPGGRRRLARDVGRLGRLAASRAGRPVVLTYAVVGDERMAELHERHVGVAGPTDVLAFPLADAPRLVADVILCADVARREARRRGHPAYDELMLYAVHGTLHLLGHDDHEPADRQRMRRAERSWLGELGIPPVYRRRPSP